jgi:CDP-diacylglycerol--glycerol-3-phosphate 3-phosphatidyltransferase
VQWLSEWRELVGVGIFLLAAATDWLDGWLARRRGEVTTLGILLDPIADKLLTSSAFISLVELGLAPAWMIVVIVGREFAVSGMRSVAAARGVVMAASRWGKLKTASQVVAIVLLILTDTLERFWRFGFLGKVMLWIVLVAALGSAADYFRKFLRAMETWPSRQS